VVSLGGLEQVQPGLPRRPGRRRRDALASDPRQQVHFAFALLERFRPLGVVIHDPA